MWLSRMDLLNLQLPYLIIILQINDILKAMRNLDGQDCGQAVHRAIGHEALERLVAAVLGDVLVDVWPRRKEDNVAGGFVGTPAVVKEPEQ